MGTSSTLEIDATLLGMFSKKNTQRIFFIQRITNSEYLPFLR